VLSKQILATHTTKTNLSLTESELTLTIRNVKNKTEYVIYIVEDGFYLIGKKEVDLPGSAVFCMTQQIFEPCSYFYEDIHTRTYLMLFIQLSRLLTTPEV